MIHTLLSFPPILRLDMVVGPLEPLVNLCVYHLQCCTCSHLVGDLAACCSPAEEKNSFKILK